MPFAFIYLCFICQVFCSIIVASLVRKGSRRFFRILQIFLRLLLFCSVYLLFLKMPNFNLCFLICSDLKSCQDLSLCVCACAYVHWRGGRSGERLRRRCAQNEWTALIHAGYSGNVDCVQMLLDAGANKNAKDDVRDVDPFCFLVFSLALLEAIGCSV